MRHSRFKFFHKPDHAQEFLDGAMFCWNAAYYRDYEDAKAAQVVGDEYEGTRLYRPLNGFEISNLTQHTRLNLQLGAEFVTKAHEIFVYCVSMSFNDALKNEFDAKACVEIHDPLKFIQRWQRALPPEALATSGTVGDYQKYVCRMVRYYHGHDLPGNVWAIPDLITTTKLKKFAYQEEYRFAYTETDAFRFENVEVRVVDRRTRPVPSRMSIFMRRSILAICTMCAGAYSDLRGNLCPGDQRLEKSAVVTMCLGINQACAPATRPYHAHPTTSRVQDREKRALKRTSYPAPLKLAQPDGQTATIPAGHWRSFHVNPGAALKLADGSCIVAGREAALAVIDKQ